MLTKNHEQIEFDKPLFHVRGVEFLDNSTAIVCDSSDEVVVFDVTTGQTEKRIRIENDNSNLNQLTVSGDKSLAAVTCGHFPSRTDVMGVVNFINLQSKSVVASLPLPYGIFYSLSSFTPDNRYFAVGCFNHVVVIDVAANQIAHDLPFEKSVKCVGFSPDGKLLACLETNGTTHFYDTTAFSHVDSIQTDRFYTGSISFTPSSRFFATVGLENRIKLFDTASRQLTREFRERDMFLTFVRFSPNGRRLVTGSMDGKVRVWHVETEEELIHFGVKRNWYPEAAFSPDSESLLIGCADKVRIIRGSNSSAIRTLSIAELNELSCQNVTGVRW